jgi:hypothetical protein
MLSNHGIPHMMFFFFNYILVFNTYKFFMILSSLLIVPIIGIFIVAKYFGLSQRILKYFTLKNITSAFITGIVLFTIKFAIFGDLSSVNLTFNVGLWFCGLAIIIRLFIRGLVEEFFSLVGMGEVLDKPISDLVQRFFILKSSRGSPNSGVPSSSAPDSGVPSSSAPDSGASSSSRNASGASSLSPRAISDIKDIISDNSMSEAEKYNRIK